jgi:hypothetical protein
LTARLPVCDPERRPISRFCSEILIFTLEWRSYHLRLAVLFADLQIHPSSLAISCAPSTHLCTDTLCLLADSLGLEDPPPGKSVTARTRRHLFDPLLMPVPPLVLRTPLLPWTIRIAHLPLSKRVLPLRSPGYCLSLAFPVVVCRSLVCPVLRT